MGKIFPLVQKPEKIYETIALIEKSFKYTSPNSFAVDFAPLMDESNLKNCYVMLDESENVIAHIGTKDHYINIEQVSFNITLLGGIAVDESQRGKGFYHQLINFVIALKRDHCCFFLLWSDQEELYNKSFFYLCGTQYELSLNDKESDFTPTKFHLLNEEDQNQIKALYKNSFQECYQTFERNNSDWTMIKKTTSADLFIRRDKRKIQDYFFMNKGQDLDRIIYEYGTLNNLNSLLEEISHYGKVWSAAPIGELAPFYQFFISIGNTSLFTQFIYAYTKNEICLLGYEENARTVKIEYQNNKLTFSTQDFLRGIFGPDRFNELNLKTFFISGLDSV